MTKYFSNRSVFLLFFTFLFVFFFNDFCHAHEKWVLTSEQIADLNAQPAPDLFRTINAKNFWIAFTALIFLIGWISLNYTGARELFPDLQKNLSSYDSYSSLALRYAMGAMLIMAALGLAPRAGTPPFEASTFMAPELELRLLGNNPSWTWLAWVEGAIAVSFFLGIYVRVGAVAMLSLGGLGFFLWGAHILDYFFLIAAAGVYLVMRGPGHLYIPLPNFPGTQKMSDWLDSQPKERATFLLRILSGIGYLYLGLLFKFAQPNLAIAVVEMHHVPTMGITVEVFVLWMAIVETLAGIMLLAGIMMRPTALFLLICFSVFSFALGEGVLAHSIAYGLLITLFINGAGRWNRPEASDLASKIVIIGNSIGGIHAALRLERILGDYTNVDVTFLTKDPFFQFNPLLPEVVGGSIQPGGVVNANRRVCPHSKFVSGDIQSIDRETKQISLIDKKQQNRVLKYDQLIIANNLQNDDSKIPGLAEHALGITHIGDALYIREKIYGCIEQAEYIDNIDERNRLLTFVVVGAGLRGAAIAAEIERLVETIVPLFTKVKKSMCRIVLVDKKNRVLSKFKQSLSKLALRRLKKAGVECRLGPESELIGITACCVKLKSNEVIVADTVITTLMKLPAIIQSLGGEGDQEGLQVNEHLQLINDPNIFVVGDMAKMNNIRPTDPGREKRLGKKAAYNAWALSQGYKLKKWKEKLSFVSLANLGKHASVGKLFGVPMHGFLISFIARMQCLLVLPGLERNTRIFFDWLLDIPFKSDIVVLSQKRAKKLEKSYFLAGQDIIRQGEIGKSAYIIESGEVEILKTEGNETKCVATLGKGSYFGEISLIYNVKANATVRCKTNVYVTELPKAEFDLLLSSFPLLKDAVKATIDKRIKS